MNNFNKILSMFFGIVIGVLISIISISYLFVHRGLSWQILLLRLLGQIFLTGGLYVVFKRYNKLLIVSLVVVVTLFFLYMDVNMLFNKYTQIGSGCDIYVNGKPACN